MSPPEVRPFGRRGVPPARSSLADHAAASPASIPPSVLAAILQHPHEASAERPDIEKRHVGKVARSLRAAVLAGLIVGLLNAALNATSLISSGGLLDELPLGQAKMPISIMLVAAGLFSGARSSAFVLLFAHKILTKLGRTSYFAYAFAGAGASLACALIVQALGLGETHSLVSETLSGLGAGFFYRLFAGQDCG